MIWTAWEHGQGVRSNSNLANASPWESKAHSPKPSPQASPAPLAESSRHAEGLTDFEFLNAKEFENFYLMKRYVPPTNTSCVTGIFNLTKAFSIKLNESHD